MIPKIIHQLWVGPKEMPVAYMDTWTEKHPDWAYMLWNEERMKAHKFVNQRHIDFYMERGIWHGVADVATYEILRDFGGFMAAADSECLLPVDELFEDDAFDAFAVYENEIAAPGLVSPLTACKIGSSFATALIEGLARKEEVGTPWKTTGNRFMQETIEGGEWPRLKMFPSHFFNPTHWTGRKYEGAGKVYAIQHWGTTRKLYK